MTFSDLAVNSDMIEADCCPATATVHKGLLLGAGGVEGTEGGLGRWRWVDEFPAPHCLLGSLRLRVVLLIQDVMDTVQ